MPYLDRNGVRIYYEERGRGTAVLLSHGYSASARMWQRQMDALSDRYHLIAFDMRGHDRSDSPADPALYSHERLCPINQMSTAFCGHASAFFGQRRIEKHADA
jgi:pimeloyl-ACP methyl ester carboxylesterase